MAETTRFVFDTVKRFGKAVIIEIEYWPQLKSIGLKKFAVYGGPRILTVNVLG